jgi:3-oxoacyl-[acyl-carrier-protein] synthase II
MDEHLKANRTYRRVVVTGIGLVSPVGIGTEATWEAIAAGKPGIGPITLFNSDDFTCKIAGEVKGFDPAKYLDHKDVKKTARFTQFALAATQFALEQSKLEITEDNGARVGVYVGSGIGGFEAIEREHEKLMEHGPKRVSPFFITATIVNLAAGQISIRYGSGNAVGRGRICCHAGAIDQERRPGNGIKAVGRRT